MSRFINQDDYAILRSIAKKYSMSMGDFGREITRQAKKNERKIGRAVRFTEQEYDHIRRMAKRSDVPASEFCALACNAFLAKELDNLPTDYRAKKDGVETTRDKRLEVRFCVDADEIKVLNYANERGIKFSALVRYCALRFDGKEINV